MKLSFWMRSQVTAKVQNRGTTDKAVDLKPIIPNKLRTINKKSGRNDLVDYIRTKTKSVKNFRKSARRNRLFHHPLTEILHCSMKCNAKRFELCELSSRSCLVFISQRFAKVIARFA